MTRALSGWVTSEWASRVSALEPPRMATRRLPPFFGASAWAWWEPAGSSTAPASPIPPKSEPCNIRRRVNPRPGRRSPVVPRSPMIFLPEFSCDACFLRCPFSAGTVAPGPQQGRAESVAIAAEDAEAELDGLARLIEGADARHQERRARLDLQRRRMARLGGYRLQQVVSAGRQDARLAQRL